MLRNIFGISKTEANGLVVLLPLMLFIILLPSIYNTFTGSSPDTDEDGKHLNELLAEWEEKTIIQENFQPQYKLFDPNKVSEDELTAMGVSERVAGNWQKYLKSGGSFDEVEDVKKIYGLQDNTYQNLKKYILISKPAKQDVAWQQQQPEEEGLSYDDKKVHRKSHKQTYTYAPEPFDINMADTTDLKKIRGIGSVFSKRIVKYRESLGGFVGKRQLREVYGLREPLLNHLDSLMFIGTEYPIRYLNINEVTEEQLARHPYLNKSKAGAIISYRYQHGSFSSLNDLYNIHLMDSLTITKLSPYIKL